MSELSNIARPYAQALFELARDVGDYAAWGDQLDLLAAIAGDERIAALLSNPSFTADQQTALLSGICGDKLSEQGSNLVKLLVKNRRVDALPDMAKLYAERRAEAESIVEADMITATEIGADQQQQFASALQAKLGRTVKLDFKVDEELIGGAVIRAGDWVVDGSVKAQLEQLFGALAA